MYFWGLLWWRTLLGETQVLPATDIIQFVAGHPKVLAFARVHKEVPGRPHEFQEVIESMMNTKLAHQGYKFAIFECMDDLEDECPFTLSRLPMVVFYYQHHMYQLADGYTKENLKPKLEALISTHVKHAHPIQKIEEVPGYLEEQNMDAVVLGFFNEADARSLVHLHNFRELAERFDNLEFVEVPPHLEEETRRVLEERVMKDCQTFRVGASRDPHVANVRLRLPEMVNGCGEHPIGRSDLTFKFWGDEATPNLVHLARIDNEPWTTTLKFECCAWHDSKIKVNLQGHPVLLYCPWMKEFLRLPLERLDETPGEDPLDEAFRSLRYSSFPLVIRVGRELPKDDAKIKVGLAWVDRNPHYVLNKLFLEMLVQNRPLLLGVLEFDSKNQESQTAAQELEDHWVSTNSGGGATQLLVLRRDVHKKNQRSLNLIPVLTILNVLGKPEGTQLFYLTPIPHPQDFHYQEPLRAFHRHTQSGLLNVKELIKLTKDKVLKPKRRSQPIPDAQADEGGLGLEEEENHVLEVVANNFNEKVLEGNPLADKLVSVYASWCGHCQEFKPVFNSLAKDFAHDPTLEFYQIDGDTQHSDLDDFFEVHHFPMLLLYTRFNPYHPEEFPGNRQQKAQVIEWINKHRESQDKVEPHHQENKIGSPDNHIYEEEEVLTEL